jgi:hypothetical protein
MRAPLLAATLVALLAAPGATAEPRVVVSDVALETRDGGLAVVIRASAPPDYTASLFDGPWRIVIDMREAAYRTVATPVSEPRPPVREVRGSQFRKGVARVVIVLDSRVPYAVEPEFDGLRVVLSGPAGPPAASAGATATPSPASTSPTSASLPAAPASSPEPPASPLQGIVLDGARTVAYIVDPATNRVKGYRVGDAVGDAIIEAIEERHVVLRSAAGARELRLPDPRPAAPDAVPPESAARR